MDLHDNNLLPYFTVFTPHALNDMLPGTKKKAVRVLSYSLDIIVHGGNLMFRVKPINPK